MGRCVCCNRALKSSEIIYYPAEDRHEDLCNKCLSSVRDDCVAAGDDMERLFKNHNEVTDA